jgi:hypothetical protein
LSTPPFLLGGQGGKENRKMWKRFRQSSAPSIGDSLHA